MNLPPNIDPWYWCTPEGSRDFDRISDRQLSFLEKLQWLEEAEELTLRFRAAREAAKQKD